MESSEPARSDRAGWTIIGCVTVIAVLFVAAHFPRTAPVEAPRT